MEKAEWHDEEINDEWRGEENLDGEDREYNMRDDGKRRIWNIIWKTVQ